MAADRIEAQTHRDYGEMGAARLAPGIDLGRELADVGSTQRHIVTAEVLH